MAFFNRTEVNLQKIGHTITVPNDPRAKLMYYLQCVCNVLDLDDDPQINRLRNYQNYYTLDNADTNLLIHLCVLLSPKVLLNKCFFQIDSMCKDASNEFYNLETVRNNLLVAGNIAVGGRNRQVTKIMTFKMVWFTNNWEQPITALMAQQQRMREQAMRSQTTAACVIL